MSPKIDDCYIPRLIPYPQPQITDIEEVAPTPAAIPANLPAIVIEPQDSFLTTRMKNLFSYITSQATSVTFPAVFGLIYTAIIYTGLNTFLPTKLLGINERISSFFILNICAGSFLGASMMGADYPHRLPNNIYQGMTLVAHRVCSITMFNLLSYYFFSEGYELLNNPMLICTALTISAIFYAFSA